MSRIHQVGRFAALAIILATVGLLFGALTAQAIPSNNEVVFVDQDFDAAPLGSLPAPYVLVQNCPNGATAAVSDAASLSPSRSLKMASACNPGNGESMNRTVQLLPGLGTPIGARWTVQRMLPSNGFANMTFVTNTPGQVDVGVFWSGDGTIQVRTDGVSDPSSVAAYTAGEFHKVETVWDFVAGDFDLYVDDDLVGTYPWTYGAPVRALSATNQPTTWYDDDEGLTMIYAPMSTVVIDGCDTGVPNSELADGSTIFELIAGCAVAATTHGQFESCVADLRNELQRSNTISANQKGAIQSCAAQANVP